ncbi:hypothetical protein GCM10010261_03240 [Streptomyces pilosus]|uniref:Uncharacterized protein n=1 Tax=Streptomyces pilosus TaxID=28893 RepID=A0A918BG02_9ACTN|nr:hypothetical protein GCM10010280_08480 [Streptomyces pilosus]GGV34542.1 hypothetical protein GCM10010261_03240 [Streptomyces pilosus]
MWVSTRRPAPVDRWCGGRGESGVLWFMTRNFPRPDRPGTPVTRPSTNKDKPVLKDACSDTENPWSVRVRARGYGLIARVR